jgi:hypothetical protein
MDRLPVDPAEIQNCFGRNRQIKKESDKKKKTPPIIGVCEDCVSFKIRKIISSDLLDTNKEIYFGVCNNCNSKYEGKRIYKKKKGCKFFHGRKKSL